MQFKTSLASGFHFWSCLFALQTWNGAGEEDTKRRKMDIKLESEDANFAFPEVARGVSSSSCSSSSSSSSSSSNSNSSNSGSEINVATVGARNGSGIPTTTSNGINSSGISSRSGNGSNSVGRVVGVTRPRPAIGVYNKRPPPTHQGPVTLTSQLCTFSPHECFFFFFFFSHFDCSGNNLFFFSLER